MSNHTFVICTSNVGYEASLEPRKLYQVVEDPAAANMGHLRVIDESGEDYLYPEEFFSPVTLSDAVAAKVTRAA
ncbi:hypothetical protein [Algiphilus sp.]|uniref:hypothetical protein n=1 Tax=Algiphilus sp. TaxID=1872431 RepID=UPI0025BD839F|nr:hypothetical protein [Abyssibacter sp.]MCK5857871.1 hypothetical protein [Abyssibacter sp.]